MQLHEEMEQPHKNYGRIIQLNQQVYEADYLLQRARFPLQHISQETSLEIRQLDFLQPNEQRVIPYPVARLQTNPFPLQDQYVRIGEPAKKPLISVEEVRQITMKKTPIILFEGKDTPQYGFLSMDWPVVIEKNYVKFHSAKQIFISEIADEFGNDDTAFGVIAMKNTENMSYTLDDIPGLGLTPDNREEYEMKWNKLSKDIVYEANLAKFGQHPELAEQLLQTKNAFLGAYVPNDTLLGIGISLSDPNAKHPEFWTGQNLLGKTLMNIRTKIKELKRPLKLSVPSKKLKISDENLEEQDTTDYSMKQSTLSFAPAPSTSASSAASASSASSAASAAPSKIIKTPGKPSALVEGGDVYLGSKDMRGSWAPRPYPEIRMVDVTSASVKWRDDFSPMMPIPGGYKGYYNFEAYWQSAKVFEGIPEAKTKKWWKEVREPKRRYPGSAGKTVLYARWEGSSEKMDYITSRKKVYVPEYFNLMKDRKSAIELKKWVAEGNDVIVYDFDGPRFRKDKTDKKGTVTTMEITVDNLRKKINDPEFPFGHGYIVAAWLKNILPEEYI
jgi:hypothetical protein